MRAGLPRRSPLLSSKRPTPLDWLERRAVLFGGALWLAAIWSGCGGRSQLDPGQTPDSEAPLGGSSASGGFTPKGGAPTRAGAGNRAGAASIGGAGNGAGASGSGRAGSGQGGMLDSAGSPEVPGGAGGAPPDCPPSRQRVGDDCDPMSVVQMALSALHTCALFSDSTVRCWGYNADGQLGYGDTRSRVAEPRDLPPLSITTVPNLRVTQLAAGGEHTCALLSDSSVKCWGRNVQGQLGYGNKQSVGDDELPSSLGAVHVTTTPGIKVVALAAGSANTCALLSNGLIKCWGENSSGQLGQGNKRRLGDDELPSSAPDVVPSATAELRATSVTVGYAHVCTLLADGTVQCWGSNALGQVGLGQKANIGDDELPASVPPVSISADDGVTTRSLEAAELHTCALLSNGTLKCWGQGEFGQLGYGNKEDVGDDELPSGVGPVPVWAGERIEQLAAGAYHTCVRFRAGTMQCWGVNGAGQLGYGIRATYIGDDEPLPFPYAVSAAPGVIVQRIVTGGDRSCAALSDGTIKCWGNGGYGQLGYGNTESLGLDEKPVEIGVLRFF